MFRSRKLYGRKHVTITASIRAFQAEENHVTARKVYRRDERGGGGCVFSRYRSSDVRKVTIAFSTLLYRKRTRREVKKKSRSGLGAVRLGDAIESDRRGAHDDDDDDDGDHGTVVGRSALSRSKLVKQ